MKIALIAKAEADNPKTYTSHKNKVTYHPENLFLSEEDKSALEFALQLTELKNGAIDVYTFEQGEAAERILHEALAMGASTATKISAGNINDPLLQNKIASEFVHYLKENNENYDLILTGKTTSSAFPAAIAAGLGIAFYDYVSMIDTSLNYEMKLEKGKITGQCVLPAVIATLDSINVPRLASFTSLSTAINSSINNVSFKTSDEGVTSEIVAKPVKNEKTIFNLEQDPKATQKLVEILKQNGMLR
ncbi:hypothetical protein [Lactobacillus kullabergensis]|uniref:Electron transfer flavoprotein small subunit n=1 Tax=Lactobacillus kullabergensis TaxID=1218493 RepID=A0ABN5LA76_9LACO|nr:hypothetical protein [Lactobacillus kullabergensis]AWM74563.1 hypothetical protein DKL58_00470 [Lactobacillus kullabergensis]